MQDMGTLKAIVGFLVIVGAIYAGFQIIPPELSNYSFQDDLRTVALTGERIPIRPIRSWWIPLLRKLRTIKLF